jgi:asparagine synthase (glutamine-hydrolysing)
VCGIAASIDLDGKGRATAWALDRIRHRGPDGEGVLRGADRNVVLEHCRLAIIDPNNPEADQPFTDVTGRWAIVYNGEVFNFREIRFQLEREGVNFRTNSDTEVVLLGFIHEGARILKRLQGMFAFVIWDRETSEIFAARDQIGVKPLYYRISGGVFLVCSEVRPLLSYPELEQPAIDPAGIVEFLAFGDNPSERTVVERVRKLLPGHFLRIRDGQLSIEEYWDVLDSSAIDPLSDGAATDLLSRLDKAVAASLVSDVPLGLMLSGGVDSSTIAALAVRHVHGQELTSYSVAFGRPDDESVAAGRLAEQLGMRHRPLRVSEAEVRGEFESWLADLDYPAGNPTWIASSFLARAAREDGIKVLLSGDGGDELFGGYNRWMKYLRFHDFVWNRVPGFAKRLGGKATRGRVGGLAGDIARRASTDRDLFVPSRAFHDDVLDRSLGPVGRAAAALRPPETRIEELRRHFDARLPNGDYLAWMSYVSVKTKLVEDYLQRLDKMGMRHSVEGRVPLLDPALAQWALRLSQRTKVPRYRQKALLRTAVRPLLPPYVLERPKQGFCPPIGSWCEELVLERYAAGGPLFESGLLRQSVPFGDRRGAAFATWTLAMLREWVATNLQSADVAELDAVAA